MNPTARIVLIVVLILVLLGTLPFNAWSNSWGYAPSGGVGFLLVVVLILILIERI